METSRATFVEGKDHGTSSLGCMPVYGLYVEHWKDITFDGAGTFLWFTPHENECRKRAFKACTDSVVVRLHFVVLKSQCHLKFASIAGNVKQAFFSATCSFV